MAITIKNSFIKEDIVDENGNKLGELKFNPNDSRIMKILTETINDCTNGLKELKKIGNVKNISEEDVNTIEDLEKSSEEFEKIDKAYDIELKIVNSVIEKLSEVFGKDTIELFTNRTKDIETLQPVLDFVMPYVNAKRNELVDKYKKKNKSANIME